MCDSNLIYTYSEIFTLLYSGTIMVELILGERWLGECILTQLSWLSISLHSG